MFLHAALRTCGMIDDMAALPLTKRARFSTPINDCLICVRRTLPKIRYTERTCVLRGAYLTKVRSQEYDISTCSVTGLPLG